MQQVLNTREHYIKILSSKSRRIAYPIETPGNVGRQNVITQAGTKP